MSIQLQSVSYVLHHVYVLHVSVEHVENDSHASDALHPGGFTEVALRLAAVFPASQHLAQPLEHRLVLFRHEHAAFADLPSGLHRHADATLAIQSGHPAPVFGEQFEVELWPSDRVDALVTDIKRECPHQGVCRLQLDRELALALVIAEAGFPISACFEPLLYLYVVAVHLCGFYFP